MSGLGYDEVSLFLYVKIYMSFLLAFNIVGYEIKAMQIVLNRCNINIIIDDASTNC